LFSFSLTSEPDVSQSEYDSIDEEREKRRRKFRFFYQANKRQLRVTLPSGPHERGHAVLFDVLRANMVTVPKMPPWIPCAATKYGSPDGQSSKEPDSGGFPGGRDTSGGDAAWPALVIECGMSQSMASLHASMRWWFWASEHRVKVVLLLKLYQQTRTMVLEKFVEEPVTVVRPGATTTRSSSIHSLQRQLQPALKQTITIASVPNSNPIEYRATSGALVLAYELLYRRAPGLGSGERDVVISEAEMEALAPEVWR
jgi:hypothetical protein